MNELQKDQRVERARRYWRSGRPLEAGQTIFESVPVSLRHQWAYNILQLAYARFPHDADVEAVLAFAQSPNRWGFGRNSSHHEAHWIVTNVNDHGPELIRCLAAQVGKIVYTAQQYPAPFDHSAGWSLAVVLKQLITEIGDKEFEALSWNTLTNKQFILLENPVFCHPGCPVCLVNGLLPYEP